MWAVAAALVAAAAFAKDVVKTERVQREVSIYLGGTFLLDNAIGDIEIVGTDRSNITVTAVRTVTGVDNAAVTEGREQTRILFGGDDRMRVVQSFVPVHAPRWMAAINYTIQVPQTVHVKIDSKSANPANRIRVSDIRGNVTVSSVSGTIILNGLTGPSMVSSANGNVLFNAPAHGLADSNLSSINGSIEVRAPGNASFQWAGETVKGDARTTFPMRVTPFGNKFRGSVNAPGGPTITTNSLMGNVAVLRQGTSLASAHSVRSTEGPIPPPQARGTQIPAAAQTIRQASVQGYFEYATSLGNVIVGEVRGNAKIFTGAGEVQLGTVYGQCNVVSMGGPLNLGDILGSLVAKTMAGDILVRASREGGTISTGGGIIRLLYNGGPTRLESGGGDIVVRQAAGPINADTQSGDITVTIDPASNSEQVTAKTSKGNVILYVPQSFGADIDATVITSDPEANRFVSDFTGLSIRREQIGGQTRIRATGKVNGGGQRVELYASDGGITISTHAPSSISVVTP